MTRKLLSQTEHVFGFRSVLLNLIVKKYCELKYFYVPLDCDSNIKYIIKNIYVREKLAEF